MDKHASVYCASAARLIMRKTCPQKDLSEWERTMVGGSACATAMVDEPSFAADEVSPASIAQSSRDEDMSRLPFMWQMIMTMTC